MIVVPVYNIILAPGASIYMGIDQIKKTSGGKEIAPGERVVLIVAKENRSFNELDENSFYPVGVSASRRDPRRELLLPGDRADRSGEYSDLRRRVFRFAALPVPPAPLVRNGWRVGGDARLAGDSVRNSVRIMETPT